jgi:hypothetical protein
VRVQQQRTDLPRLLVSTLSFSLFKKNNNDNMRLNATRLNRFFSILLLPHLIELLMVSNFISFFEPLGWPSTA